MTRQEYYENYEDYLKLDLGKYGSCGISVAMEPEPGEEASQEHIMNEEGRARTP